MTSSATPAGLPPAKLASKRALAVHLLAGEIQADPERKGRRNKLRRLMAETDALAGVGPEPGTPDLGEIGSGAFHHALAAFYRRHGRLEPTIEACQAGVGVDPGNIVLRRLWLETLNSMDRLQEAGLALELPPDVVEGPDRAAALELLQRAEKLFRRAGEGALLLDAQERAAMFTPWDSGILRRLALQADVLGDGVRAARLRARLRDLWVRQLPERLADGLAALKRHAEPTHPPEAALAWAWALADKDVWREEDWRREIDWGARATKLLIQWWSIRPERAGEIAELVIAPDLGPVRAGHAAGRAQVMVGAHGGPAPAAIHLFQASGLPFRTLGGTGLDQLAGEGGTLIGVQNRSSAARDLVEEVRRGAVLAVAADSPTLQDRVELQFLGRKVAVKSLPARLAQRYGCDTWWYQPLWRDDHIVIELRRLPDPEPDEPPQVWVERWAQAYLKKLKRVMRGDPRNLNLAAGIWRFAEAKLHPREAALAPEEARDA